MSNIAVENQNIYCNLIDKIGTYTLNLLILNMVFIIIQAVPVT